MRSSVFLDSVLLDSWPPETRRCPVPFLPESSTLSLGFHRKTAVDVLAEMFPVRLSTVRKRGVFTQLKIHILCIPIGVALIMIIEVKLFTFEVPNILLNSENMPWNWEAGRKCKFLTGGVGGYGKCTCWSPLKHGCTVALSLKSETWSGRNHYFYTGVPKQIHQIC